MAIRIRNALLALLLPCTLNLALAQSEGAPTQQRHQVDGPVFDIAAAPDGSILFTGGAAIFRLGPDGIERVATVPAVEGSPVNGLHVLDDGRILAASGGLDLALGAGVWSVSDGTAEMIADIENFEITRDPDATEGSRWKEPACEDDAAQGFTAGPQSNPYHLTTTADGTVLTADAAGNTLLSSTSDGTMDWVATFDPPVDDDGNWRFFRPAENDPDIDCWVQPVPTAAAVGPDGAIWVGELTGAPAVPGWSRVWRIEPGATNVTCPSDSCTEAISGLTSVIDVAFGPDGALYVVELDQAGWLAVITGSAVGGAIKRCDTGGGTCTTVHEAGGALGAIAWDPAGNLWTVENSTLFEPGPATVRRVDLD